MRTIQIDFTQAKTSVGKIGYVGEHNQTEIVVTPPVDLSGDENVISYRIAFGVGENKVYSETYPKADTISCLLWQQVTAENTLGIQLEAYDNDGDLIAKSAVVYGFLSPSVDGNDETADFTDPIIADITANTLARHTHTNKAILDSITAPPAVEISDTALLSLYTPTELRDLVVDNAVLFYQDIPIVYYNAGTVFDFAYFSSENDIIMMRYKRVDTNKGISDTTNFEVAIPIEITTPTNASKSLWTPAELEAIWQARKPLTYSKLPILARQYDSNANTFKFAYCFSSIPDRAITFNSVSTVNAGKSITSLITDKFTIPLTVNTKNANTSGAVTIMAEDISATSGWTPSNDTDLATKKYVDDNAGGGGAEFIITITDVGGTPTADKTESEIYQAWTDGLPIVIESGTYRVPMIAANYENGEYEFYCVCADIDTTVITYYAHYSTSNGWELDVGSYVPPVTDVVDGNGNSVINNGVVTLADVAISNSYNDLDDQPTIPSAGTITSGNTGYATGGDVYSALGNKQDTLTAGTGITIDAQNVISASVTIPVTDVQDSNGNSLLNGTIAEIPTVSGWVAQTSAPVDTSVLWIDTDDNTVDALVDADNQGY